MALSQYQLINSPLSFTKLPYSSRDKDRLISFQGHKISFQINANYPHTSKIYGATNFNLDYFKKILITPYFWFQYEDDEFEYQHVILPEDMARILAVGHLMSEADWRRIGFTNLAAMARQGNIIFAIIITYYCITIIIVLIIHAIY